MDAGAGGEDDHGQTLAPASDLGQDFVSVHEETEVEDDQVEVGVAGGVGGGVAVLDDQGR